MPALTENREKELSGGERPVLLPVRRNREPLCRAQQRHRATQRHFERLQISQRGEFRPCTRDRLCRNDQVSNPRRVSSRVPPPLPEGWNRERLSRAQQRHRATERHSERLRIGQRGEFRPAAPYGL